MQAFEVLSSLGGVEVAADVRTFSAVEGVEIAVPLNCLFLSPFNVRKMRNAHSIPELAEQIDAETLLNRLGVVAEEANGATGRYGVVAGGRRLAALQYLAENGRIALDALIPCKSFDSARAVGVSLTENAGQEAMHPADMAEAFKALVDEGKTLAQIAGRFGVSELTVERRLKIANLAPKFLDLYRAGEIEPKQLQALALTNDHAKQVAVWDSLGSHRRSAYHLQQALTESEMQITSPLARFVGLAAYEQAGGAVRRDLFDDANGVYLQDAQLVQKLAEESLEKTAEQVRAAGWKWVEVRQDFGYQERGRFTRSYPSTAKPTAGEREGMEEISSLLQGLAAEIRAIEGKSDQEFTDEEQAQVDALEEQIDELRELHAAMHDALRVWTPEQLANSGVVVTLEHDGEIEIVEGLVRAEDRKAEAAATGRREAPGSAPAAKAEFSKQLTRSMTAHRTAAVAAALTDNPHVALVALLHRLILAETKSWYPSPVRVSLTSSTSRVRELADEFDSSMAAQTLDSAQTMWGVRLPGEPAALFRHLMNMDMQSLNELLALQVARSYDVITEDVSGNSQRFAAGAAVEAALGLKMTDWWAPDAGRYLSHVSKAKMMEAVTEACGAEDARPLEKMKKAEAVAAAAAKLEGTGWLPAALRAQKVVEDIEEEDDDQDDDASTEE
ncbi:ParB/RepB/Spo0J family partition protein [Variovorax sp. J22P271]|uniref:ParB/RepB/Spo0J family partition protein n=1 Tax=Variovorax davisae TaxID=3053515 RepID=UPI0025766FB4|nr:ParB/RepB/Spo0J family partition protein [Variovorax sp. J22P271]MDM0036830.1 ParB/RepB/Spo0J family partition protein [Variovorax sp. J22P271]